MTKKENGGFEMAIQWRVRDDNTKVHGFPPSSFALRATEGQVAVMTLRQAQGKQKRKSGNDPSASSGQAPPLL